MNDWFAVKTIRNLVMVCVWVWVTVIQAPAQPNFRLGLQFSSGKPSLTLTGEVGAVYWVQHAYRLSPAPLWANASLLQVRGPSNSVAYPFPLPVGFYRAVSVGAAPADKNLVFIQPGTFTMGSPTNEAERNDAEVQHTVTITRGFWMGKFLVTQAEYLSMTGVNPSLFQGQMNHPVEQVDWGDATNYCGLRTQRELASGMIPKGFEYRLPTEAEWEYACRAGTTTAFYVGNTLDASQANFDGTFYYNSTIGTIQTNGIYLGTTTPVGSYPPNAWGLYDMMGNVVQWCKDLSGPYPTDSVVDPQGRQGGGEQRVYVTRSDGWYGHPNYCRSAARDFIPINNLGWYGNPGFRVVLAASK